MLESFGGESESFTQLTDSITDSSIPERHAAVPSASQCDGKSVFMSLLNTAEVNVCEWLLKKKKKIQHHLNGPL